MIVGKYYEINLNQFDEVNAGEYFFETRYICKSTILWRKRKNGLIFAFYHNSLLYVK